MVSYSETSIDLENSILLMNMSSYYTLFTTDYFKHTFLALE